MLKRALLLFFLFLINCTTNLTIQVVIIDDTTSKPIEGAWVYLKDKQIVLRSDINGTIQLPKKTKAENIEITAKN
ncbi:MAG: hypothetical protein V3W20_13750, partial [Candidatus Neomarinimicrobiota bacterium]